MMYRLEGQAPTLVGSGHFIAPDSQVIGRVILHPDSSIWFGCVVRGDVEEIEIGPRSNIQDGTVIHADPGYPVRIGPEVTVGHGARLHGCEIGEGSLVGIGAVVLNGARIGRECLIGAGALVTEGADVPDGSVVLGMPGKVRRTLDSGQRAELRSGAAHYVENGHRFLRELEPLS